MSLSPCYLPPQKENWEQRLPFIVATIHHEHGEQTLFCCGEWDQSFTTLIALLHEEAGPHATVRSITCGRLNRYDLYHSYPIDLCYAADAGDVPDADLEATRALLLTVLSCEINVCPFMRRSSFRHRRNESTFLVKYE